MVSQWSFSLRAASLPAEAAFGQVFRGTRRPGLFALCSFLVFLGSCKKEEEDYKRGIKYQATCDRCQVSYTIGTTEIYAMVNGSWEHFFRIYQPQYLSVKVIDSDSIGTSTAKVLVNGTLMYEASNTGALDTAVIACGYP
jgi:hypothetical protein